jgi:hypothetical protein
MTLAIARTPAVATTAGAEGAAATPAAAVPTAVVSIPDTILGTTTTKNGPTAEETRKAIADSVNPNGPLRTETYREGGAGFAEAFLKTFAGKSYDKGQTATVPQLGEPVPQDDKGAYPVSINKGKEGETAQVTVSADHLKAIGEIAQVHILGLDRNGKWTVVDTARKEAPDRFVFGAHGDKYTGSTMLLIEPKQGSNQFMPFHS